MGRKIFVFRHTETIDNKDHIFSGRRDVGLTAVGLQQAQEVALKLKTEDIRITFSSPMMRTVQTLEIVLQYHQESRICLDQRIIERSYGYLEGQNKDEWAKKAYLLFKIFHRSYLIPPPGGESLYDVRKRVIPFINDIVELSNSTKENIAICAHGNSIRAIREYFEHLPNESFSKIESPTGSLFTYELEN